jgi:hypothetical protein
MSVGYIALGGGLCQAAWEDWPISAIGGGGEIEPSVCCNE